MPEAPAAGATPPPAIPSSPGTPPNGAAPSSLQTIESNLSERAKGAKTIAEIRAVVSEAKRPLPAQPKPEAAQPAGDPTPEPAPTPAPEAPAAEPAPAPEAPAEPATPETPAAPEPDEGADAGDEPLQPVTSNRPRVRLPQDDKVGRLATSIMQQARGVLTMEEALAKARVQLGVKPAETPTVPAPEAPKSDLPETVEAVDQSIDQLEAEVEKASTELRFEDVAKAQRKIRQLDRHRLNLERTAEKQQAETLQNYEKQFAQSEARATELYEFASQPDSPAGKRMMEIEAEMKENGDPLYFSADKPLRIAQMAAAELNIAPRKKGAPPAPAKAAVPTPPPAPPKPKQVLPTGSARTTPPATNQQPQLVQQVQDLKIRDVRGLRNLLKAVVK